MSRLSVTYNDGSARRAWLILAQNPNAKLPIEVQAMEFISVSQQTGDLSHALYEQEKGAGHVAEPMMAGIHELLHVSSPADPFWMCDGRHPRAAACGPVASLVGV